MTMGMNLGPGTTNGIHGSSHTAFVVQNSLRPPQPPYAFSLSTANGSGCFPSPPTIPSLRESIASYDIPPSDVALLNGAGPYRYGGYYGPYGGSSPGLLGPSATAGGVDSSARRDYLEKDLPSRSNPLPVPPRESTYEPKPADYWIGYSSLATSV
ncbi:hypothetical protein AGABI2DRAFT_189353 [Agaricus bisporus var. bisporus H97]|nr:hypothetical protein AGABI2DRAFT_189353 [Agaricus bisporus var. bisporus H97]EKV51040.1 hypothetical protein AGABI2DRAFT_189353 [Agaricus bisporus var. bisporus H97]